MHRAQNLVLDGRRSRICCSATLRSRARPRLFCRALTTRRCCWALHTQEPPRFRNLHEARCLNMFKPGIFLRRLARGLESQNSGCYSKVQGVQGGFPLHLPSLSRSESVYDSNPSLKGKPIKPLTDWLPRIKPHGLPRKFFSWFMRSVIEELLVVPVPVRGFFGFCAVPSPSSSPPASSLLFSSS